MRRHRGVWQWPPTAWGEETLLPQRPAKPQPSALRALGLSDR